MATRIELVGWKIHRELEMNLCDTVDLLFACNGDGKTAIIDAIEFILRGTGKLAGIGSKGDLGQLLIHDDFDSCSGELVFSDGWGVLREMARDGTQKIELIQVGSLNQEGQIRSQQTKIDEHLGLDEPKLLACLDARRLFTGSDNERKAILFGASGQVATKLQIIEEFADLDLEGDDVVKAAQNVINDGWRPAEKVAGQVRAGFTAQLRDRTRPVAQPIFQMPGSDKEFDLREWTSGDLERRRKKNQAALDETTRSEGEDLGAAREALRAQEDLLQAALDSRDSLVADGAGIDVIEVLIERNAQAQQALVEAREANRVCQFDLEEVKGQAPAALDAPRERPIAKIPEPCCPVINGCPECPMSKAALLRLQKKIDADFDDEIGRAQAHGEAVAEYDAKLQQVSAEATIATDALQVVAGDAGSAAKALSDEQTRIQRLAEIHEKLDIVEAKCIEMRQAVNAAPEAEEPAEGSSFHQERLDKTLAIIDALRRYQDALATAEEYDEATKALKAKHQRADKIAQALKPAGIESELLKRIVAPLQQKLDEVAKHTGAVRITDELHIEMLWGPGDQAKWRRWQQLSESQRERMAVAVQHAICSLAGFPILVVDQVDHLDQRGKGALMRALVDVSSNYGAVLALATCQKPHPTAAPVPGVVSWFTEDGKGAVII